MTFPARLASFLFMAAAVCGLAATAHAQAPYPNKPLRFVVPFAAGGPTDVLARAIGQKLGESLGQPVVVENRPGAGGNIASDFVAKSAPDGYTLVLGTVGTHAINGSLYGRLPFDIARDFEPVGLVASATIVLVSHSSVPAASVKELVALAKGAPGSLSFGSAGSGTPQHLAGELFKTLASVDIVHVPYKGAAPALNDLLGGQVSLAFVSLPAALPHVKAGKLRALGITAAKRSAVAPEVPTIAEGGVTGYEVENWYALFAPAGTPKSIVDRLNAEVTKVLQAKDVRDALHNQGFDILPSTPGALSAFVKKEIGKWAGLVKMSGAKAD